MGSVHILPLALINQIVKMKFLVIFSACLAASFGSIIPHGGFYGGFPGPLSDQVPAGVAGLQGHPNGAVTPIETPSVLAARRDHFIAKDAAYAAAGPFLAGAPAIAPGPAVAPAPAIGFAPYAGPLADDLPAGAAGLVGHPNGAVTPAETPSVSAARRDHLIAKDAAYAAAGPFLAGAPAIAPGPAVAPAIAGPRIAAPAFGPAPVYGHTGIIPVGAGSPTGALVSLPNGAVVPV